MEEGCRREASAAVWTLVEVVGIVSGRIGICSIEDYTRLNGHLILVNTVGVQIDLPKSAEPTTTDPARLYLGHTPEEILKSAKDLLGSQILAKHGDPSYEEVASAFAPIRKMQTYSFVGTHDTIDKVGFSYGGRSPDFDPASLAVQTNAFRWSAAKRSQVHEVLKNVVRPRGRF
jgi:hypothetical protein